MLPIIHRAMRAAVIFLAHAFLACVLVFGTWLVDLFIRLLSGSKEIMIYGVLPLSYLSQTVGGCGYDRALRRFRRNRGGAGFEVGR